MSTILPSPNMWPETEPNIRIIFKFFWHFEPLHVLRWNLWNSGFDNFLFFQGWGEIPWCGLPPPEACDLRGGLESGVRKDSASRICSRWRGFFPLLYKWLFSGPFFGRFIKKRPTLTTNHLLFTFHLYLYLSLVSSLWALIFIQYLLFIEKYIYRNQMYLLLYHIPVAASQIPFQVRYSGLPM